MNLTEKKEQLIKEREEHQKIKDAAHFKILLINAQLRKLETVVKAAEGIFKEDQTTEPTP
jgi:hypothetical protein